MNSVKMKHLAKIFLKLKNLYIFGKGNTYPIAREIALKIKELTYVHAEAFPSGEFKHGPMALIESNWEV